MLLKIALFFCSIINPYFVPAPENPSNEDYLEVQTQIRKISLSAALNAIDPEHNRPLRNCWGRYASSLFLEMIDPYRGHYPIQSLEKINQGGPNCIVCYASYNRNYHLLLRAIPDSLRNLGFNGYFYYRIGGYPTPRGMELQYAATPYGYKIFMMVEAQKLGFDRVLWMDATMLPLRDPTPLFDVIEQTGALLYGWKASPDTKNWIFPQTLRLLENLTGADLLNGFYIRGAFFGLKMSTPQARLIVDSYYKMVELGTPFFSCYPDEFVLSALVGQADPTRQWQPFPFWRLVDANGHGKDLPEPIEQKRREGFFFYWREH